MPSAFFQVPMANGVQTLAYGDSFVAAATASPAMEPRGVTRGSRVGADSSSSSPCSISGSPVFFRWYLSFLGGAVTTEGLLPYEYFGHCRGRGRVNVNYL